MCGRRRPTDSDGFTPLALASAWTPSLNLGVAIIPAYTRGPALLAQSVAAMAEAAPGRFTLGLGTSSDVIVSRWNGIDFADPYKRVRDTIRFLRVGAGRRKGGQRLRDLRSPGIPARPAGGPSTADLSGRTPARHAGSGRS